MRFVNPIPFVSDISAATRFYRDTLGLKVVQDLGNFVLFEGHFALHDGAALARTVWGAETPHEEIAFGRRNLLLYFEDEQIEACFARLRDRVTLIHPLRREPWGQRVFRFYDLDRHVVEVGEPLNSDP